MARCNVYDWYEQEIYIIFLAILAGVHNQPLKEDILLRNSTAFMAYICRMAWLYSKENSSRENNRQRNVIVFMVKTSTGKHCVCEASLSLAFCVTSNLLQLQLYLLFVLFRNNTTANISKLFAKASKQATVRLNAY